jgi:hypothetical protein
MNAEQAELPRSAVVSRGQRPSETLLCAHPGKESGCGKALAVVRLGTSLGRHSGVWASVGRGWLTSVLRRAGGVNHGSPTKMNGRLMSPARTEFEVLTGRHLRLPACFAPPRFREFETADARPWSRVPPHPPASCGKMIPAYYSCTFTVRYTPTRSTRICRVHTVRRPQLQA